MENMIKSRACNVRDLRKSVDSLTNNVVIQLNTINRLLKERTIRCRACNVRDLRKSIDSLTNNVVIQLNTINRLLKELEQ